MSEQAIETGTKGRPTRGHSEGSQRQLSNLLFRPRYSLKFVRYFIAGGLATTFTVIGFVYLRLLDIDEALNSSDAMSVGGHIPVYDAFTDITTISIAGLALFVIYACIVAMVIEHRVAGPMTALVDSIDQIKRGNFDYQRDIRKHDQLLPLHDAIRDLSRALKEAQKPRGNPQLYVELKE